MSISIVENPSLVLVSKSPRRRRLLELLGLPFSCTEVDVDERIDLDTVPMDAEGHVDIREVVTRITRRKIEVAHAQRTNDSPILCFDTIVAFEGEVLGKPANEADARATLSRLSGHTHHVATGMAIWFADEATPRLASVVTDVQMNDLGPQEIDAWIVRGEYAGCAGSYNIEAQIAAVADDQCFQSVAGLPLCHLYEVLHEKYPGSSALTHPRQACNAMLERVCFLDLSDD